MSNPEENQEFAGSFMAFDARKKRVDNLGDKYQIPLKWAEKLPVKLRKVTDLGCLICFGLVVFFMIMTTFIIFWRTDHHDLYKLYDSSGNDCGVGGAKDYPYLFMQTLQAPYKSVCVKECPVFDYNQIRYNSTAALNRPLQQEEDSEYSRNYIKASHPMPFMRFNEEKAGKSVTHTLKMSAQEIFGFDEGFANDYYTQQNWENYLTKKMDVDCLVNNQITSCKYKKDEFWIYDTYPLLGIICVPLSPKTALHFYRISSKINHGVIGDIMDARKLFLYCALISLGFSLIYLILTRFCGKFIVWLMGILLVIILFVSGILIFVTYHYKGPLHETANHLKLKYLSFLLRHKVLFHLLAIVLILLSFYMIYLLYSNRKTIGLALPLLEIAARSALKNILLVVLSIIIILLQIFVFFFEMYVLLRIFVMGNEVHDDNDGSPFVFFKLNVIHYLMIILHIVGTYWILIFLNNLNDFFTAAVTLNFYFQTKINNINIFCHTIGHNLGSIAWTIVLLPVLIVKIVFWPFKWCFTSENPSNFQKKVNSKCHSCCVCYEYVFDSICENYMALTYMGSEGFLLATRRYFFLTQKYLEEHQTVSFLSFLYNLLGRGVITFLGGYCGVLIYRGDLELEQNIKYVGVVFVLCYFICFVMGSIFINLFSTSYDTMLICYLTEFNLYDQMDSQYTLQANDEVKEALKNCINPQGQSYMRLLNK
jgi:hypothetical protein